MRILLAIVSLLFLQPMGARAQCDETTRQELRRAGAVFTLLDYSLTHETFCGRLRDDEYTTHTLTLPCRYGIAVYGK